MTDLRLFVDSGEYFSVTLTDGSLVVAYNFAHVLPKSRYTLFAPGIAVSVFRSQDRGSSPEFLYLGEGERERRGVKTVS